MSDCVCPYRIVYALSHPGNQHTAYTYVRGKPVLYAHGLSSVIERLLVAPPGMRAPWQIFAAARPLRRTVHVPQRPFLQSNLMRTPACVCVCRGVRWGGEGAEVVGGYVVGCMR